MMGVGVNELTAQSFLFTLLGEYADIMFVERRPLLLLAYICHSALWHGRRQVFHGARRLASRVSKLFM